MTEADGMILGVLGNPILHSRSPEMQRAALKAAGICGEYLRLAADSFAEGLLLARAIGLRGFNVTAPFKSAAAEATVGDGPGKSVNTVWDLDRPKPQGASTDGFGVLSAIRTRRDIGAGLRAVVLGAGGAAEAALSALVGEGVACSVCARSGEASSALARRVGGRGLVLGSTAAIDALRTAEVLVSCIGDATFDLPRSCLPNGGVLLQSVYGEPCALDRTARSAGMEVIPGTEWLLHQGAKAFQLFTGRAAHVDVMRSALQVARPIKSHCALVGLMGAGKSTVAPLLAALLKLPVVDLDTEIVQREGRTVSQVFQQAGEDYFRRIETEVLANVLRGPAAVVACGGGAVVSEANRALLASMATTVWLWVSPSVAVLRLAGVEDRPLLSAAAPGEVLSTKLSQRRMFYAASDLVISTDARAPRVVAERIFREVHRASHR